MGSKNPRVTSDRYTTVETVAQAFRSYPQAQHTLYTNFPHVAPSDKTLSLAACTRLSTTLTPTEHPDESFPLRFDRSFGAQIAHAPSSSTSRPPSSQFIIGVRLVGVLVGTSQGTLAIRCASPTASTSPSSSIADVRTQAVPILIAPAPPPHFRGAPVYVSDWRFLPAHRETRSPPIFEALQQDVHVLSRPCPPPTPSSVPLSPQLTFEPNVLVTFHAAVVAKSPAFKSSSGSRKFLVEVSSPDSSISNVAVFVVFNRDAVAWWPFVHPGLCIVLTNLNTMCSPAMPENHLLCTTSSTAILTFSFGMRLAGTHPSKRKRLSVIGEPSICINRSSFRSGTIVTYEGTITKCFPSTVLQLDDTVLLNLSELDGTVVGRHPYRTFRVGTRLRVTDVIVVLRPSSPPRLYATARSSTDILFFADIHAKSVASKWGSQWRRLTSRLSPQRVAVSEDILNALLLKFRHWFQPSGTVQRDDRDIVNPRVTEVLLGERGRSGLVQCLMFRLGDSEEILHLDRLPVRIIYKEFTTPAELDPQSFETTALPTVAELRETISCLWEELTNRRGVVYRSPSDMNEGFHIIDGYSSMLDTSKNGGIHDIFSFETIVNRVLMRAKKRFGGSGISLVGVINGAPDGSGRVYLSDATDLIDIRCVGSFKPKFFEAMVCINRFSIVGDTQLLSAPFQRDTSQDSVSQVSKLKTQEDLTLIFEETDANIVVDGPFADTERDKHTGDEASLGRASQLSPRRVLSTLSQSANVGRSGRDMEDSERTISDAPLICVFVEQVKSGGQSTLSGRFMAMMENRMDEVWTVVDNNGAGFWRVEVLLSGEAWLKMIACFEEGQLFALSCTHLKLRKDPKAYVIGKALEAQATGKVLQLTSKLSDSSPWIENLGLGIYLRFAADRKTSSCDIYESLKLGDLEMSPEGEQYMYFSKAVEQFRSKDCGTIESRLWKLYEWKNELEGMEERTVHFRGIISYRQLLQTEDETNLCPVEKVTIIDETLGVFPITVCFYDNFPQVHGLARGMRVIFWNVVRVPITNGRGGFEFVGNLATSVRIVTNGLLRTGVAERQERCSCGISGKHPFWKVSEHLRLVFLDEFVQNDSLAAGIVRFYDVRVEWMEMHVNVDPTFEENCVECSLNQKSRNVEDPQRRIHIEMIAEIDDGSRVALIRCRGMGTCMRILAASHFQRESIRHLVRECDALEINLRGGENVFLSRLRAQLRDSGKVVWQLLNSRGFGGVAAVLNSSASRPCRTDPYGAGSLDRVVAKWFKMGYGRGMSIKCSPSNRRLFLDAIIFFEESQLITEAEHAYKKQQDRARLIQPHRVSPTILLELALHQRARER